MKEKKSNGITLVALMVIMLTLILCGINNKKIINKISEITNKEKISQELLSYVLYDNRDAEKLKVLATINSENGIEYIEDEIGNVIYGNGKTNIVLEYEMGQTDIKTLKIKEKNNQVKEKQIILDQTALNNTIEIEQISATETYKVIKIKNNINIKGYTTYYKIGEIDNWTKGNKIYLIDGKYKDSIYLDENNKLTIYAKTEDQNGNIVYAESKKYEINTEATECELSADSLLDAMEKYEFGTGEYEITVKDEKYILDVTATDENMEIEPDDDGIIEIGNLEDDCATGSDATQYAKRMVVLYVNADLTIDEGATLTTIKNKDGYGGPKGFLVYCTGKLINNGNIDMTARGAYVEGQNVYLWKNKIYDEDNPDMEYEMVPAEGADGGTNVRGTVRYGVNKGNDGQQGTNRKTGGGGSGSPRSGENPGYVYSGAGAKGTSYSGGTRWCRSIC